MFRSVDVLPAPQAEADVARHLLDYFRQEADRMPSLARLLLSHISLDSSGARLVARTAPSITGRMASWFSAGSNIEEIFATILQLPQRRYAVTLDFIGEAVLSDTEADAYEQSYVKLIAELAPSCSTAWNCLPSTAACMGRLHASMPR